MFTCGNEKPAATAKITGSEKYNTISGRVDFYDTYGGTIVTAKIQGIPEELGNRFWGFHIHEGSSCTGNADDLFADEIGRASCRERV